MNFCRGKLWLRVTQKARLHNDVAAENGMTCIATVDQAAKLISVPYSYIYDTHYSDQNGKNWSVIKEDEATYSVTLRLAGIASNGN